MFCAMNEAKYNEHGVVIDNFDKERDIRAVDQFGFINLKMANAESSVPAVDGLDEERYNGIDDPRSIGGRPSDPFEGMQANKAIVGYKAPVSEEAPSE